MSSSKPLLAAVFATGLLTVVGCSSAQDLAGGADSDQESESPQPTESPTPEVAPAPEDGACRMLTLKDIPPPTNDDPVVPCDEPHTAQTFHVGQWPKRLVDSARDIDDPKLQTYVYEACNPAWRQTVGGSRETWDTSIVSWAWYKPKPADFRQGAHWFRCDVVAGSGTKRLEKLPDDVDGLLDGKVSDRYRACWTKRFSDKPGADEGHSISCARKHQQRAVAVVRLGKAKAPYPGRKAARNRSNDRCRQEVNTSNFGYSWPRKDDWQAGDRFTTCWAVTSN